jgi:hypothetical protein
MTIGEFQATVADWLATARHPRFDVPYTSLVYRPMLELLDYLRANGFKTFIVSGGGIDFMRVFIEDVYGIPPEQSVGSMGALAFEMRDDGPVLVKQPGIDFIDDNAGRWAGTREAAGHRLHRRQGRQAGRHRPDHRPATDRGRRQLGRRPRDAAVHGSRTSVGWTRGSTRRPSVAGRSYR